MLDRADGLVAYRTCTDADMASTGKRAFALLEKRWASGSRAALAVRRLPFLVPICWQCTDLQPAARLYALLEEIEAADSADLAFATGFPAADFPQCSPVILPYANHPAVPKPALHP